MKYSCSTTIDLPRDKMLALFEDTDRMGEWQDGFISFTHLSGEKGATGSQARIEYQMGKRKLVMTETLEVYGLPERLVAIYEADKVWNRNDNRFTDQGQATRWDVDCEFRCGGFVKLLSIFIPSMFRKQTEKMLTDFKKWAEAQG